MQTREKFEKESGEYAFIVNPNYIEWLEKQCSKLDNQETFIKRLQGIIEKLENSNEILKGKIREFEDGSKQTKEGDLNPKEQIDNSLYEVGVYKKRLEKGLATPEDVEIYRKILVGTKDCSVDLETYLGFSTYDSEQYTKHGLEYLKKLYNSNKE